MNSYEYAIDEKSLVGSRFISEVNDELKRALFFEKEESGITQQSIADKLEVHRSVVNRRFMGLENLTARSIAETLWAIGWEPQFKAVKIESFGNEPIVKHETTSQIAVVITLLPTSAFTRTTVEFSR